MDKSKIETLKDKRQKLFDEIDEINNEIRLLEVKDFDFRGKFIYYEEYGYMYVDVQRIDNNFSSPKMWFQGFGFYTETLEYRDSFFANSDAMMDWYIDIEKFKRDIQDNKIHILNRNQFESEFHAQMYNFTKKFDDMISRIIENHQE